MNRILLALMVAVVTVGLLAPLRAFAQGPTNPNQIPNDQTSTYTCSLKSDAVPTITAERGKAAALAANPGTTALSVGLDDENGCLVYGVQLSNGADVKVHAGSGQIVHTEPSGPEDGGRSFTTPESGG